ncbi:ROK family transcriptional regulator [Paenibacillus sp. SYP-B3998]|uniref:ROK family transcriptional regulator n=1 Tax=Paenibacillus sp. SYP-B3998 TaxID=2678564 RepID=A0A6G4A473_9BACL|nr:ROK family transcriptional regulator [Paenibacillus sp. SYP-B3998]NEW09182.1 ROK family transcriptional regulator [Paenibacillus sp. SYP-B3998]
MKTTGDQNLIKKINKSIVLDMIRAHSPISRAAVSEMTGLNKGTVSSLVNELIESELVYEIGPGKSSGGRKPLMLLFNKIAGYAIGVEIGLANIFAVLTNLNGEIVEEKTVPIHHTDVDYVIQELNGAIRSMIDLAPQSPYGVVGIGIGVPGIVDEHGNVLFAPNLQWEGIRLQAIIAETFGLPVTIDNEANAGVQGEKQYGAGKEATSIVYISVGDGIGTGIILGKELYRGVSGLSGEMGHMTIEAKGKKCRCGNKGCWELYASLRALLEQAKALPTLQHELSQHSDTLFDFDSLLGFTKAGNPDMIQLFHEIGEYLGIGIANIINTFNPDLILIGNRIVQAQSWIESAIQRTVSARSLPYHRNQVKVQFAHLDKHSTVLGAAFYAISGFLSKDRVSID